MWKEIHNQLLKNHALCRIRFYKTKLRLNNWAIRTICKTSHKKPPRHELELLHIEPLEHVPISWTLPGPVLELHVLLLRRELDVLLHLSHVLLVKLHFKSLRGKPCPLNRNMVLLWSRVVPRSTWAPATLPWDRTDPFWPPSTVQRIHGTPASLDWRRHPLRYHGARAPATSWTPVLPFWLRCGGLPLCIMRKTSNGTHPPAAGRVLGPSRSHGRLKTFGIHFCLLSASVSYY